MAAREVHPQWEAIKNNTSVEYYKYNNCTKSKWKNAGFETVSGPVKIAVIKF